MLPDQLAAGGVAGVSAAGAAGGGVPSGGAGGGGVVSAAGGVVALGSSGFAQPAALMASPANASTANDVFIMQIPSEL